MNEQAYYMAQFLGMLTATCLDPFVIIAAIASAFIGKTYGQFISWSFGIGFVVSIGELVAFGQKPGGFMPIVAVPLLANIVLLLRTCFHKAHPLEKELPLEDTEYFRQNYLDKKED